MPLSEKESKSDYLVLPLDVPPPPLFSDSLEQNIIPQVPLFELMNKFDGVTEKVTRGHAPGVNDSSKWPAFGLLALLSVCSLSTTSAATSSPLFFLKMHRSLVLAKESLAVCLF